MRGVLLAGIGLMFAAPAMASGGISCSVDDSKARLELNGATSRGMGGAFFSFGAELTLADPQINADLRKIAFERVHLAQNWHDEKELKLRLYREREGDKPHGYVELLIETELSEEGIFKGRYVADVYDMTDAKDSMAKTVKIEGAMECMAE